MTRLGLAASTAGKLCAGLVFYSSKPRFIKVVLRAGHERRRDQAGPGGQHGGRPVRGAVLLRRGAGVAHAAGHAGADRGSGAAVAAGAPGCALSWHAAQVSWGSGSLDAYKCTALKGAHCRCHCMLLLWGMLVDELELLQHHF